VQYYYYEEMSVGAIADIMECSQGTVKSRLSYARKSLKTEIEKFEIKNDVKLYSLASLPLFYLFFRAVAEGDITLSADVAKGSDVAQENDVARKSDIAQESGVAQKNDVVKGNNVATKIAGVSNKVAGSGFLGTLTGKAVVLISVLAIGGSAVGIAAIGMQRQQADIGSNQNPTEESENIAGSEDTESTQDVTDSKDSESTEDVTDSQDTEITSEEPESTPEGTDTQEPESTPEEPDSQEPESMPGEPDTQEPETTPDVTDAQVADILARNQAYRQYLQDNSIQTFAITDINKDGTKEMLIYTSDTGNPTSIVGWHEGQLMVENGAERPLDGSGVVELYYSDESDYVLTVIGETDGALEDWGEIGEGTITRVYVNEEGVYYGNTHFYSDDTGEWRTYSLTTGEDDLSTNKESIIALIKEKVPNMKKWTQSYEVTDANLDTYLSLDEDVIRQEIK